MLTLADYRAIIAIAEEAHFGRAARRLGVSQPALSARLRRVEAHLEVRLFRRSRSGVAPTDAGRTFLDGARRLVGLAEEVRTATRGAHLGLGQSLRLGMTQIAAHRVVVPALRRFRAAHPEVRVDLIEGTTAWLEADLEARALDAAFLHPPLHAPGLTQRLLARHPIVRVTPSEAAPPTIRYVRAEAPVVMGAFDRLAADRGWGEAGPVTNTVIGALTLAQAGYGAALVPRDMPQALMPDGAPAPVAFVLDTALAWRGLDRRPALLALVAACEAGGTASAVGDEEEPV